MKHIDLLFKLQKDTENLNSKILKIKNGRPMLSSKCSVCGNKKSKFIKEQETKGLLSSLGLKTRLNEILLLGKIFFNLVVHKMIFL